MRRKNKRRAILRHPEGLEARSLLTTLIALVDTGIDLNANGASFANDRPYYDLADAYNAFDGSGNVQDNNGHGSAVADSTVAGIQAVAAQAGVSVPNVQILPIRDTNNSGGLDIDAIINGICYAADKGAKVINLSFAGPSNFSSSGHDAQHPFMSLTGAIQYAQARGSVVVAAAGNNGDMIGGFQYGNQNIDIESPYPLYPPVLGRDASLSNMIVTASFNAGSNSLQSDSNYGPNHVQVAAPAPETSFAAAYLSGVIGEVAALRPDFSYSQLINRVMSTVQVVPSLAGKVATGGVVSPAGIVAGLLAPSVVTNASATPAIVIGNSSNLSVLGGDAAGENTLTYHWRVIGGPGGAPEPTFSANDSNAAKQTSATFASAGAYTFQVTISNGAGATTAGNVTVNVAQTPTSVAISPVGSSIPDGGSTNFTATAGDQFHVPFVVPPSFTWSVTAGGAGGSITPNGTYTAPLTGAGVDTVTASLGNVTQTTTVTVTVPTPAPRPQSTPAPLTAKSLGQDGVDVVGNNSGSNRADGFQDVDILLSGLPSGKSVQYVDVMGYGGGEWQYNAPSGPRPHGSDAAALVRAPGATSAHLYVSPYQNETGRSYDIHVTYDDGTSVEVYTDPVFASARLPMPSLGGPPAPLTAKSLGQDGVDVVGNNSGSNRADGYQDVDILLSGLPSGKTVQYVDVMGYGGGEWQYNAPSGPRPHGSDAAALVRVPGATSAHLYVSPYQNETGRSYDIHVSYDDGTSVEVYTDPVFAKVKLKVG